MLFNSTVFQVLHHPTFPATLITQTPPPPHLCLDSYYRCICISVWQPIALKPMTQFLNHLHPFQAQTGCYSIRLFFRCYTLPLFHQPHLTSNRPTLCFDLCHRCICSSVWQPIALKPMTQFLNHLHSFRALIGCYSIPLSFRCYTLPIF